MLKIFFWVSLILCGQISFAQDSLLVKQGYGKYKSAILNDKGEEAAMQVNNKTIEYYDSILKLVKTADSSAVRNLSFADKFTVLAIRHIATNEDLQKMNGKQLFVYSVNKGLVGKNSVMNTSVTNIQINGDFAKGQMEIDGKPEEYYFHFYKEDFQWKIDLTQLLATANLAFEQMIDRAEISESELLNYVLENLNGKKPSKTIWHPFD